MAVACAILVGIAGLSLGPAVSPASAQPTVEGSPDGRDQRGRIVRTSPALDPVPVHSVAYDGLAVRLAGVLHDLAERRGAAEAARAAIAEASTRRGALEALSGRARLRHAKLAAERERFDEARVRLAVKAYTTDRFGEMLSSLAETPDEGLRRAHDEQLLVEATKIVHDGTTFVAERLATVERDLESWGSQLRRADETLAASEAELRAATSAVDALTAEAQELREGMERERPETVVADSDLPFNALDAYWRAANTLAASQPACRLPWWLLAGVGRSESNHARSGGSQMTADGTLTAPVIGIALDGTNSTRAIADTDLGLLDRDVFWDRAVGPMQFIPGTWRRWGVDGNGDGAADPQNMYDAALAAGRLLCSGGPVESIPAMRATLRRYNNSPAYVDLVMERAIDYSRLAVPFGLVGELTHPSVLEARRVAATALPE